MAQLIKKMQSGGKTRYGKLIYDGVEYNVDDKLLDNLRSFNEVGGYAAKSLIDGNDVSIDFRGEEDGYITGVEIPGLTSRESKQLSRVRNTFVRPKVAELKDQIKNLKNLSIDVPVEESVEEPEKPKKVFDADNEIRLVRSKDGKSVIKDAAYNMAKDRINAFLNLGEISDYDEYKFYNPLWENQYDRAKSYTDVIRNNINEEFYNRLNSGELTEGDVALLNDYGIILDDSRKSTDDQTDFSTVVTSGDVAQGTNDDTDQTTSDTDNANGVISNSSIPIYNDRIEEKVLLDDGSESGIIKWVHKDNPNDIILYMPSFSGYETFGNNNFRLPSEVSEIINKYPYFWTDLAKNQELQKHFTGSLNQLINSGWNEFRETLLYPSGLNNLLPWADHLLTKDDLRGIGFSSDDAKSMRELLYKFGNRSYYDDGKKDRFSRRNQYLVRPYVMSNDYIKFKDGGKIKKCLLGDSLKRDYSNLFDSSSNDLKMSLINPEFQYKTNSNIDLTPKVSFRKNSGYNFNDVSTWKIPSSEANQGSKQNGSSNGIFGGNITTKFNVDPDLLMGLADLGISKIANKTDLKLGNKAIDAAALGAQKQMPNEIYSRFNDYGLYNSYNNRIQNARNFKAVNSDPRLNMSAKLINESKVDSLAAERDAKYSSLLGSYNDNLLNEKRQYEAQRRQIGDYNRNILGSAESNKYLNARKLNTVNAESDKLFIANARQNYAANLNERLQAESLLKQKEAAINVQNSINRLYNQKKHLYAKLPEDQRYSQFASDFADEIAKMKYNSDLNLLQETMNDPRRIRWNMSIPDYKKGGTLNVNERMYLEKSRDLRRSVAKLDKEIISIIKGILRGWK